MICKSENALQKHSYPLCTTVRQNSSQPVFRFLYHHLGKSRPDGSHTAVPGTDQQYVFFITSSAPIKQTKSFLFDYQSYFNYQKWVAKVSSRNKSMRFLLANISPCLGSTLIPQKGKWMRKSKVQEPLEDCFGQTGICFPQIIPTANCEQSQWVWDLILSQTHFQYFKYGS